VGLFLASLASEWPWESALGFFETLLDGWLSPDRMSFVCGAAAPRRRAAPPMTKADRTTSTNPPAAGAAPACLSASFPFGGGIVTILTSDDGAVWVLGTSRLSPAPGVYLKNCRMVRSCRPGRAPFPSKFAPECIRMPCVQEGRASRILPPPPDTGAVVDFRDNWERLVGPLTGEVRAIIMGLLNMPRTSHEARRSFKKNHPSFQDDPRAHEILGAKAAAWLYHGILEFCPADRPPSFVEPIGAVPKKPDSLRMINDGREGNKDMAAWPVRYTSPKEVAAMLSYGDFAAGSDFDDAYHASKKGGCCGRIRYERVLRVSPEGCAEWGWQTRVGCSPESCSGTCDKARSGISFGELLARFASCHFGEMTAGSPLNALVMQLRRYFATRGPFADQRRVATAAWVDDMLLILKNIFHGFCGGLDAGCPACAENKALADTLEAHWLWLAPLLGFSLSTTKRQLAAQRFVYSGILFDTIRGLYLLPADKRDKILEDLSSLLASASTTARDLAVVAGRLLHYSICLRHVRPFIPLLWARIGSESPKIDYDLDILVDAEILSVCSFLLSTVPAVAPAGAPLWPLVSSSAYGALCRGDPLLTRLFAVSSDASLSGSSVGLQTPEARDMEIFPLTWPAGGAPKEQVDRETLGICIAFEAAAALVDLSHSSVILRNDSKSALSALRKGSTGSPFLQTCAMRLHRFAAAIDTDLLFLHVPGDTLIAEGIDEASRSLAEAERGPACGPELRAIIRAAARRRDWTLSVDLFACGENSLCPRFYSRYPDAAAAATNALTVPCWNASSCPACGLRHREASFAFPPRNLISAFIAKAAADRIRAIVLVPLAVTEPFWPALLQASVVDGQGFDILRRPGPLLLHAGGQHFSALALFAVDFGAASPADPLVVSPCARACDHRPRPPPMSVLGVNRASDALTAERRLAAELADRAAH
jgi:hypothetical protein